MLKLMMMFAVAVLLMATNANAQHINLELEPTDASYCYDMNNLNEDITIEDYMVSVEENVMHIKTHDVEILEVEVGDIKYAYVSETNSNFYTWKSKDDSVTFVYQSNPNIQSIWIKSGHGKKAMVQTCTDSYHKTLHLKQDMIAHKWAVSKN